MNKRNNRIVFGIVLVATLAIIFFNIGDDRKIRNNYRMVEGRVVETKARKGGGRTIVFEYIVDGKSYRNSDVFGSMCIDLSIRVDTRNFPVICQADNPENCRILITAKSFERFAIQMPDSLNWVNEFCK